MAREAFLWVLVSLLYATATAVVDCEGESKLFINELMASNGNTNLANLPDNEHPDWLELHNAGPNTLELSCFIISDTDNVRAELSEETLAPGGYIVLLADKEESTTDQYQQLPFKLSAGDGETLTLYKKEDPEIAIHTVTFPGNFLGEDEAFGLPLDVVTNVGNVGGGLMKLSGPTPGAINEDWYLEDCSSQPGGLVVNELMTSNDNTVSYTDDGAEVFADWIELYNAGRDAVNLACFRVENQNGEGADLYPTAETAVVFEPGAFVILWADNAEGLGTGHLPFKLNQGEDGVVFVKNTMTNALVNVMSSPAGLVSDQSYGRTPDGGSTLTVMRSATPAASNTPPPGPLPYTVDPVMYINIKSGDLDIDNELDVEGLSATVGNSADNTEHLEDVGIEQHGVSAARWPKKSYRVKLPSNHPTLDFVGNDYDGMKQTLVLKACWVDPLFIREKLVFDGHRALGGLGPRTAFAVLYFNDVYHGLYLVQERPDKRFLSSKGWDTGGESGNLYKAKPGYHSFMFLNVTYGLCDYKQRPSDNTHNFHEFGADNLPLGFLKKTENSFDTTDINELYSVTSGDRSCHSCYVSEVSKKLNLTDFYIYQVVQNIASQWDGFTTNYYMYHHPSDLGPNNDGRLPFRVLMWDSDASWGFDYDGTLFHHALTSQRILGYDKLGWWLMPDGSSELHAYKQWVLGNVTGPDSLFGSASIRKVLDLHLTHLGDYVQQDTEHWTRGETKTGRSRDTQIPKWLYTGEMAERASRFEKDIVDVRRDVITLAAAQHGEATHDQWNLIAFSILAFSCLLLLIAFAAYETKLRHGALNLNFGACIMGVLTGTLVALVCASMYWFQVTEKRGQSYFVSDAEIVLSSIMLAFCFVGWCVAGYVGWRSRVSVRWWFRLSVGQSLTLIVLAGGIAYVIGVQAAGFVSIFTSTLVGAYAFFTVSCPAFLLLLTLLYYLLVLVSGLLRAVEGLLGEPRRTSVQFNEWRERGEVIGSGSGSGKEQMDHSRTSEGAAGAAGAAGEKEQEQGDDSDDESTLARIFNSKTGLRIRRALTLRPRLRGTPPSAVSGPELSHHLVTLSYTVIALLLVDVALFACVIAVANVYDSGAFLWLLLPLFGHIGVLVALCLRYRLPRFYARLKGRGEDGGRYTEARQAEERAMELTDKSIGLPGAETASSEKYANASSVVLAVTNGVAFIACIAILVDGLGHPLAFSTSRSTALALNVIGAGSLWVGVLLLALGIYTLSLNSVLHCPIVHKAALVCMSNAMVTIAVYLSLQVYTNTRNDFWSTDTILFLMMSLKVMTRELHRLYGVYGRGRTQQYLFGFEPRNDIYLRKESGGSSVVTEL